MRTPTALILALSLAACDSGNPKEAAFEALNSGDYAGAVARFDRAMEGAEAGSSEHVELAIGRCEALAHTDGAAARDAMIALAGAHAGKVTARDYGLVASRMVDAGNFDPAIDLVDDGIQKRFQGDPKLVELMDGIVKKATRSGDDAAMDKLEGLGYTSGD